MRNFILFLLLSLFPALSAGQDYQFIQLEMEWAKPLNLKAYGGSNIDVAISMREMTYVSVVYFSHGASPVADKANIEKKNAMRLPGTNYDMFCIYEDAASGVRVYFLDSAAKQNHDWLVVAVPKKQVSSIDTTFASKAQQEGKLDHLELSKIVSWYKILLEREQNINPADRDAVLAFRRATDAYHKKLNTLHPMIVANITEVRGYFRKNGIFVEPYFRTQADQTTLNNWSHEGNVNPFTGKKGYNKD